MISNLNHLNGAESAGSAQRTFSWETGAAEKPYARISNPSRGVLKFYIGDDEVDAQTYNEYTSICDAVSTEKIAAAIKKHEMDLERATTIPLKRSLIIIIGAVCAKCFARP